MNVAPPNAVAGPQPRAHAQWRLDGDDRSQRARHAPDMPARQELPTPVRMSIAESDGHPAQDIMNFSIILTTYNRPHLLKDALDSLGRQTLRDFEVILVNDHGAPVEHLLAACDFPVTYIRQGRNRGISAARNAGLRQASGRYVAYLDDDDLYLPHHLATLAEAFERDPDCVAYTDAEYVQEVVRDGKRIEQGRSMPYRHDDFDPERLLTANYIPVNTWAHPREAIAAVGEFDEGLAAYEDWDMLLRLLANRRFVHVPTVTAEVRVRDMSADGDHLQGRERKNFPALLQEIYRRHPGPGSASLDGHRQQLLASWGLSRASVSEWLAARVPSPAQARWIERRLASYPAPVSFAIVVRGAGTDGQGLRSTLESLEACLLEGMAPDVFVLGDGEAFPPPSRLAGLRSIAVGEDGEIAAINRIAAATGNDWLLIVDAGEAFTRFGLPAIALELLDASDIRAVYADEMMRKDDGEQVALFRPDFNLDLLLSMPAGMSRHWLFRRDVFLDAGGLDPARAEAAELDLLLRLIEHGGIEGLGHVHEPLLAVPPQRIETRRQELDAIEDHLRNRGYERARVEPTRPGCYRIDYGHQARPGVSIIIPTRDQFGMLSRCVESLLEKTAYENYEVLIVDNGSTQADACTWLDGIEAMGNPQLRVLRYPHPFDHSAMNNLAARHARGEYLLLLNNDTAVLQADWLDALLNHAQRPEVGVVGAKLLHPDGCIQHAGMVLGLSSPKEHPFAGQPLDAPGYMYRLQVDQNYSAVSGACLMIRKSLYEQVGGLDETGFEVSGNDVDLCLKVRAAGYLVVWTPHALLMHEGGASLARVDTRSIQEKARSAVADQDRLYERWLPTIARDPAYNRNLTLNGAAFQVQTESQLNWRPLGWRPLPVVLACPADQAGCGHYRIIQPVRAIEEFGLAEGIVSHRYLSPVEMERLAPDTLVLQRQMTEQQIEQQKRVIRFNGCFKVAELDDYLPNVPRKSAHYGTLPKDILKTMRKALTLVDRFIVSTPALAEALDGLHPDIRVVENRLPLPWWGQAKGLRRQGRKPRVGWGGGAGHRGDLEMIADVVAALADEVEWVFFGMCPDGIRPYVHEFHPGVPIEDYPAKLASLNLDLALAPLEDNLFNQCKSNLRLLELGACGFPVVCSDVRPYQCDLPVTRVKPRFRDWVDAIRMHVHDLDAAAKAGDALREAIHRDWMLDQTKAQAWLAQWLPG